MLGGESTFGPFTGESLSYCFPKGSGPPRCPGTGRGMETGVTGQVVRTICSSTGSVPPVGHHPHLRPLSCRCLVILVRLPVLGAPTHGCHPLHHVHLYPRTLLCPPIITRGPPVPTWVQVPVSMYIPIAILSHSRTPSPVPTCTHTSLYSR